MTNREIIVAYLREQGRAIEADWVERGQLGDKHDAASAPAPLSDDARAKLVEETRNLADEDLYNVEEIDRDRLSAFLHRLADTIAKDGERKASSDSNTWRKLAAERDALASQVAELQERLDRAVAECIELGDENKARHGKIEFLEYQVAELRKALWPYVASYGRVTSDEHAAARAIYDKTNSEGGQS